MGDRELRLQGLILRFGHDPAILYRDVAQSSQFSCMKL
jgi:hypothetical protein